jgi:predicted ATP-grasp superfamily ATP-dependent carboligase
MARVLITGGRAPAALDLARQLATAGDTVYAADSVPCFLAGSSRAVTRAFRIPPPRQTPQAFAEAVLGIVRGHGIERIIPTCEEVFYLAHFASRLRPHAELFCPDLDLLRELHSKWSFAQGARGLGIEVPDTWLLLSPEDVERLPLPPEELVLKPVYSRFAVHTLIRPTTAELRKVAPTGARPWAAQRFVSGREVCSYSVARAGRLTAHAAYAPSWRLGRGSGYYFEPVRSAAIETFTSRFVAAAEYTGQIAFDFIEAANGIVYVIECNPRATSGIHLFRASDRLATAFDGRADGIVRPAADEPGMLVTAMALFGTVDAVRQRRIRQLATDVRRGRDAVWSWRDPLPTFYVFVGLAAYVGLAARQGISPRAASTQDIEWDGEAIA